jgi:hypothetical protein
MGISAPTGRRALAVPVHRFAVRPATSNAQVDAGALPIARRRRRLTGVLGLVWLLDAGLQYQPYMFTAGFPSEVIKPVGDGNPIWIQGPVSWSAHLMAHEIVLWNALFATVQLAIGLGLLNRRTIKPALAVSVAWSLTLWWLGEGLGGLLAGPASALTGLPGAALLYALAAVLLWPRGISSGDCVATTGLLRPLGARISWVAMWSLFAVESALTANKTPFVLAVCFALTALGVFVPRLRRPTVVLSIALAALIWIVGEHLGEITSGQATDPNSGPLLVLLALCFWPLTTDAHCVALLPTSTK